MPYGLEGKISLSGKCMVKPFKLALGRGWTCLLGPSGAGKSTLLRLLGGLETQADFAGERHVPGQIGWMAQADLLQPRLTIVQNVLLLERLAGRKGDAARAEEWLASVGLQGYATRYPESLSGGQRQRVALARTLMADADLILLDEPFSALDPATRASMQELAHDQFKGRTVVLVTHDPTEALRLGDAVYLIENEALQAIPVPQGVAPRDLSDPDLALASSALLQRIRRAS